MALPQSALSELLEAFRTSDGPDFIRECVRVVMQELIEAEAAGRFGAGRYERTETRDDRAQRVPAAAVDHPGRGRRSWRIPKRAPGRFFPSILLPRRRIDQALYAVIMEAYVHGVSTRRVDDLVVALGGTGSPSPR